MKLTSKSRDRIGIFLMIAGMFSSYFIGIWAGIIMFLGFLIYNPYFFSDIMYASKKRYEKPLGKAQSIIGTLLIISFILLYFYSNLSFGIIWSIIAGIFFMVIGISLIIDANIFTMRQRRSFLSYYSPLERKYKIKMISKLLRIVFIILGFFLIVIGFLGVMNVIIF